MQTLQISDQVAKQLNDMAKQQHLSSSELIERLVEKYRNDHELLEDLMDSLPNLPTFKGAPMDIQRAMRDDNLLIENARQQELKAFFAGYKRDLSGFKFNREEANER
jgi:predicted CopG family antitoxin